MTQDTNGKVKNSQLYTTNESQEVIPFPTGDYKAQINRHAQVSKKALQTQDRTRGPEGPGSAHLISLIMLKSRSRSTTANETYFVLTYMGVGAIFVR